MKKIIIFVFSCLMVLSGFTFVNAESQTYEITTSLSFDDQNNAVVVFHVPGETNLAAADFVVSFNNSEVTCKELKVLTAEGSVTHNIKNDVGQVKFSYIHANGGLKEDIDLLSLTFEPTYSVCTEVKIDFIVNYPVNDNFDLLPIECIGTSFKMHQHPYEQAQINVVEPECEYPGSYDLVERCPGCKEIFSSEHIVTDPTGHDYGDWVYNGEQSKTHTMTCANNPEHKITGWCEFDSGILINGVMTYTCKICGGTYEVKDENPDPPQTFSVVRVAGNNRYETSQKITKAYMKEKLVEKLDAVILVDGNNFADALAGSYLSKIKDAPIIITKPGMDSEVNRFVKSVMSSNGTVYVLGGTAAIPESCLNGLKEYNIERIAGNNRYLTNLEILDKAGIEGDTILVATGTNYADSLSASATGLPMLLVKDALSEEQKEFLTGQKGKNFIILGGPNAVSESLENEIMEYGNVERIQGSNRVATSLEIAERFFPEATISTIAYSHNFPDGLCGGPLANHIKAPLILTREEDADMTEEYLKSKGIMTGYILGGKSVLSDSLITKLFDIGSDGIIDFSEWE